jgi:hypothetical protein
MIIGAVDLCITSGLGDSFHFVEALARSPLFS